jgi:hypothetical protein
MKTYFQKFLPFLSLTLLICFIQPIKAQSVIIEEILYNPSSGISKKIALRNISGSTLNISNWCLCNFPTYRTISTASTFTILEGDPSNLGPNGQLLIELSGSGFSFDNTSELAIYHTNGCSGFTTPGNMEDYVAWGASGTRSQVAVNAGLWTSSSAFVPVASTGNILVFDGTNTGPGNISSPNDFSNQPTGILPIKLHKFTANRAFGEVILSWTTLSEINLENFLLKKSIDGRSFDIVSKIQAKGNSNKATIYNYADKHVNSGAE